jgi:hypothetical protein
MSIARARLVSAFGSSKFAEDAAQLAEDRRDVRRDPGPVDREVAMSRRPARSSSFLRAMNAPVSRWNFAARIRSCSVTSRATPAE